MAGESDIMLGALQRRDGTIDKVLCHSGHCILYNFNTQQTKWIKTEIEGNLFVYERTQKSSYGFTLMNIKSQQNFTETLSHEVGLQLNFPYLLYKNTKGIYAVWFHDKEDSKKVFKVLTSCLGRVAPKSHKASTNNIVQSTPLNHLNGSSWKQQLNSCILKSDGTNPNCGEYDHSILSMLHAADSKINLKSPAHNLIRTNARAHSSTGYPKGGVSASSSSKEASVCRPVPIDGTSFFDGIKTHRRLQTAASPDGKTSAFVPVVGFHRSLSAGGSSLGSVLSSGSAKEKRLVAPFQTPPPNLSGSLPKEAEAASRKSPGAASKQDMHPLLQEMFSRNSSDAATQRKNSAPGIESSGFSNSKVDQLFAVHQNKQNPDSSCPSQQLPRSESCSPKSNPKIAAVIGSKPAVSKTPVHLAPQSFSPHPSSEQFIQMATGGLVSKLRSPTLVEGDEDVENSGGNDSAKTGDDQDTPKHKANASPASMDGFAVDEEAFSLITEETFQALQLMAPSHFMSDEDEGNSSCSALSTSPSATDNESNFVQMHHQSSGVLPPTGNTPTFAQNPRNGMLAPQSNVANSSNNNKGDQFNSYSSSSPSNQMCNDSQSRSSGHHLEGAPVLTIGQMQQAMIHLVQNDHAFVRKLYDAYLSSVGDPCYSSQWSNAFS